MVSGNKIRIANAFIIVLYVADILKIARAIKMSISHIVIAVQKWVEVKNNERNNSNLPRM